MSNINSFSKKILITGCSSGIGLASAKYFVEQGWEVIATIRNEIKKNELEQLGVKVKFCDITNYEQVEHLFSDSDLNNLDACYLNVGFGYVAAVEDIELTGLEQQINTNIIGTWHFISKTMKIFRKQDAGRLLICSSVISFAPIPFRAAYGASKAFIDHLAQTLRVENNSKNIHISIICPGPVATNFRAKTLEFYNQYTDKDHSLYKTEYMLQEERMKNAKSNYAIMPTDVAKRIYKILTTKKPKFRYLICKPTYFVWFAKKLLPESLFEKVIKISHKLEK